MKHMLDKIEREEKISLKRKLREETQVEKRQRTMANRLSTMLQKQKETLRREIMSRREHLEQGLKRQIQVGVGFSKFDSILFISYFIPFSQVFAQEYSRMNCVLVRKLTSSF